MKLSISLPDELGREIRASAREQGVSISEYMAELARAEQRSRAMDAWADEVLADSPPTDAEQAEVEAVVERARRRADERRTTGQPAA